MIKIEKATKADTVTLALLGRVTWKESHGQYIEDNNDKLKYLHENFSVAKTAQNINNPNHLYYIVYVDNYLLVMQN